VNQARRTTARERYHTVAAATAVRVRGGGGGHAGLGGRTQVARNVGAIGVRAEGRELGDLVSVVQIEPLVVLGVPAFEVHQHLRSRVSSHLLDLSNVALIPLALRVHRVQIVVQLKLKQRFLELGSRL
jgi:hypothetical protein